MKKIFLTALILATTASASAMSLYDQFTQIVQTQNPSRQFKATINDKIFQEKIGETQRLLTKISEQNNYFKDNDKENLKELIRIYNALNPSKKQNEFLNIINLLNKVQFWCDENNFKG